MAKSKIPGTGTAILTWKKAECDKGISHYRVYIDNKIKYNTRGDINSADIINLPLYTELSFKVVALTKDCRVSAESNTVQITLGEDGNQNVLNYNLQFYI